MFRKCIATAVLILSAGTTEAHDRAAYPQDYFRNPLRIPMVLAGNFGECRPNHFHSGIDIKTQGRENLPVYAAAAGYISRIKMEPGGFGHALYVTHPNGYTTLYAHLNNFSPAVQRYVRKLQYERENWELDEVLSPQQFPVQKGEQIAWSGNTGGSTAPHLHFEIRDTRTEHPLNPLLFGLPVADHQPPLPKQLALYNLDYSIYEQQPVLLPLRKKGTLYAPAADTIDAPGAYTGLGLYTDGYMDGSQNTLAFYTAEWAMDGEICGRIRLDDIGYDVTRYLHAYADYKTKKQSGEWFQSLFQLPGNRLSSVYEDLHYESPTGHKGVLTGPEGGLRIVHIMLEDAAGNKSTVSFVLRFPPATPAQPLACTTWAVPGTPYTSTQPNIRFTLPEEALYDRVCFALAQYSDSQSFSPVFRVHTPLVPLHRSFDLRIRPSRPVPFALRQKIALRYDDGNDNSGKAAAADGNGWYKASVRAFGNYRLVADTTAPVLNMITPLQKNMSRARSIVVQARDAVSSVKTFRAELDGKWILFEQHGDRWTYRMDEHCSKGAHELKISASDENGNTAEQRYRFIR